MKKMFTLFLLMTGICSYAQVQSYGDPMHYVIRIQGDTIYGSLKYKSSDDIKNKITVKVNDTLKYSLKAQDIKYFRDGAQEYVSFQPDMEAYYFLRVWQPGKYLSLYEWQVPSEISGDKVEFLPYLKREGENSFIELDIHWQKHFVTFIEDYKELVDDIWKNKYKLEQLGDVVKKYNDWKATQK